MFVRREHILPCFARSGGCAPSERGRRYALIYNVKETVPGLPKNLI